MAEIRPLNASMTCSRWSSLLWLSRPVALLILAGCGLQPVVLPPLPDGVIDGPYVTRGGNPGLDATWLQETAPDEWRAFAEPVPRHRSVAVPSVGTLPQFTVRLRPPARPAADQVRVHRDEPILVVADTHGEYPILVELLQRHGIIDEALRWRFGRGRLAVLGDVLDRGPHQLEILWLLYQLEAEAAAAGGGVHLLLGNHESMVLRGDLRYLNPKYVRAAEALGAESYAALLGPETVLGQWLRSKPAVLKLNDLLLLHGGISPAVVGEKLTLGQINGALRRGLGAPGQPNEPDAVEALVLGGEGPTWYRGYFASNGEPAAASEADVDHVLRHFAVRRILVGHTQLPTVTALFDGRVIGVQVYPRFDKESGEPVFEALLIRHGRYYRAKVDGTLEALPRSDDIERKFAARRLHRQQEQ